MEKDHCEEDILLTKITVFIVGNNQHCLECPKLYNEELFLNIISCPWGKGQFSHNIVEHSHSDSIEKMLSRVISF
jgi:hypothetical protein